MTPSLTFNAMNGCVQVAGFTLTLRKGLLRHEVASALGSLFRTSHDLGNGYEWLSFHNVTFGGQPCGFAVCFHDGRLTEIHLSVTQPGAEMNDGWPTRRAIEEELAFMRKELSAQLDRSIGEHAVRFTWGTVWSTFDPKGFQASTGVRYEG